MREDQLQVALVMDGSRRHYDVAKALELQGCLNRMFADWYATPGSLQRVLARALNSAQTQLGRKMLERFSSRIPSERVISNPLLTLKTNLMKRRFPSSEEYWAWVSKQTAAWITKAGFGTANALYGYIRNVDPELCGRAREGGLKVMAEQMIAPAAIEMRAYESQQARWPDWEPRASVESLTCVEAVEQETWANVDRIVAPSQYVVDALQECGVERRRIDLIPYPAEFSSLAHIDRSNRRSPVTIGFVGQVNLRKNAPVFLEIAKRMASPHLKFEMVGKVYLNEAITKHYSRYVDFVGTVPRSAVAEKLASFDLFLFPSTCEGSAGVVLEAMATGLPILTTASSGTLVDDGCDGFICPSDDPERFISVIERLCADRMLRLEIGREASRKVSGLTLERYGRSLAAAFTGSDER